jgi:hypothetical protein
VRSGSDGMTTPAVAALLERAAAAPVDGRGPSPAPAATPPPPNSADAPAAAAAAGGGRNGPTASPLSLTAGGPRPKADLSSLLASLNTVLKAQGDDSKQLTKPDGGAIAAASAAAAGDSSTAFAVAAGDISTATGIAQAAAVASGRPLSGGSGLVTRIDPAAVGSVLTAAPLKGSSDYKKDALSVRPSLLPSPPMDFVPHRPPLFFVCSCARVCSFGVERIGALNILLVCLRRTVTIRRVLRAGLCCQQRGRCCGQ